MKKAMLEEKLLAVIVDHLQNNKNTTLETTLVDLLTAVNGLIFRLLKAAKIDPVKVTVVKNGK